MSGGLRVYFVKAVIGDEYLYTPVAVTDALFPLSYFQLTNVIRNRNKSI
jgi:hypothetical protein